jgi:hypothetical protein
MGHFDAEFFSALVGSLPIYLGLPFQMTVNEPVLFFMH